MPRKKQGGARQGLTGSKYPNRSDLANGPRKIPVQSGHYGERAQLERAQANTPDLTTPTPSAPSAMPAPGAPSPGLAALPPADPGPPPPMLTDPTARPEEPLTSGIDMGPGVGSGALGIPSVQDADLMEMQKYVPALEHMSTMPAVSATTRAFIRKLRAQVPPQLGPSA